MDEAVSAARAPSFGPPSEGVSNAVAAAQRFLLSIQHPDGHWCGELEGDTILESEYILTLHFLGRTGETRVRKAAEYLRRKQLPGGGWPNYEGGPADVSVSVKAYFALKLAGDDADAPHMARARRVIRNLGGLEATNSFTRIYLSIFGQWDWEECPAVPPELILLPDWFPFNIYKMSSWSRGIVVPLAVLWAHKPSCRVPGRAAISELKTGVTPARKSYATAKEAFWGIIFTGIDRLLKAVEAVGLLPWRKAALEACETWISERLVKSDGLGAIYPPIINTIIAFRCLGYALDDPRLLAQTRELEKLELEDEETLHVQPCFSPVWDTAIAMVGLAASGVPADDPEILRAAQWLVDREVREVGDWKVRNPEGEPGGWYFEYANEFYPDTDDTAEVLTALTVARFPGEAEDKPRCDAIERGRSWLLTMQNRDGGWGAFDKGCNNEIFTLIPFADHNAMIDPSCEDITGRALEALHALGDRPDHPAVGAAVRFVESKQLPDGTWYGRWGCNYIYGTFLVLRGLKSAGVDMTAERYQRAGAWIAKHQNPDGGWGESPRSYDDPALKGIGPSTPSQTAWALMALFALNDTASETVRRGVGYLLRVQQYDGSWKDAFWTGTGFPKVFYLRYHLYATYFPLWALSLLKRQGATERAGTRTAERVPTRAPAATGASAKVAVRRVRE
jgi:squalene-hopene/tetraprenyl-beta-curcumene cyclase